MKILFKGNISQENLSAEQHLYGFFEFDYCKYPGGDKAPEKPYSSLLIPKQGFKRDGGVLLTKAFSDGSRENGFKLRDGRFRTDI